MKCRFDAVAWRDLRDERRSGVWRFLVASELLGFAMKRVFAQKRIVFLFLEAVRSARAFLVPPSHVARNRFTKRLRFSAFQGNDLLRHKLFFRFRYGRLFFFAFAFFVIGQTEKRGDRLANARRFALLLELRLAFHGKTRERDRFQPGTRNWFA